MAREITVTEIAKLRGGGQYSRLYLAIHQPAVVFQCQLNGGPISSDGVIALPYDTPLLGDVANVLSHMTLLVGTGPTGASRHNKGILRIRKEPSGGVLYIGETSEVLFSDNDYLTVVDEFSIFQRHLRIDAENNNTVYMDQDIAYTDQHEAFNPVPIMGSHAVGYLTGAQVDIPFDASESYCYTPGASLSYEWVLSGGSFVGGPGQATVPNPTVRYTEAGTYRVTLTVTDDTTGKTSTGHRVVMIFDDENPPYTDFVPGSISGNSDAGGWQFDITAYSQIDQEVLRDQALVILFSRDWYNGVEESLSPVPGRENIIALGWVDGETISWNGTTSQVNFLVKGPHFWLNKIPGYPVGVEDSDLPAEETLTPNWTTMDDLTVGKGLFHFFYWRSTAWVCTDIYQQTDSRQLGAVEAPITSLWQQLTTMAYNAIFAKPLADRYGRIFTEIDAQLIPPGAERDAIPVVQTITSSDWGNRLTLERHPVDECGYLEVSGVAYVDGVGTPICTRAYGTALAHHGRIERRERLAFVDTTQAVQLTGLLMGQLNNEFPNIVVNLASNHRFFDLAPLQRGIIDLDTNDTLRGITLADRHVIPRRVTHTYDPKTGVFLTDVVFEAETFALNAQLTSCPEMPVLPDLPIPDPITWPEIPPPPTWEYLVVAYDYNNSVRNLDHASGQTAGIYVSGNFFTAPTPYWENISDGIPVGDLPFIEKITGFSTGTGEITLFATVGYTFGGYYFYKIFKIDNLLSLARWHLAYSASFPSNSQQGYSPLISFDHSNPNRVFLIKREDPPYVRVGNGCDETGWPKRSANLLRSTNGGVSFTHRAVLMSEEHYCPCSDSATTAWYKNVFGATSSGETIKLGAMLSTGSGNFAALVNHHYFLNPLVFCPEADAGLFIRIMKETEGGDWVLQGEQKISSNYNQEPDLHVCGHNDELYVLMQGIATLRSDDGGLSFTLVGGASSPSRVSHQLQSIGIASDGSNVMSLAEKSTDGISWTANDAYEPYLVAKCVAPVPYFPNSWVIGGKAVGGLANRAIYYSDDFGTSWINKTGTGMFFGQDIRHINVIAVPV